MAYFVHRILNVQVYKTIEKELGNSPDEIFSSFDDTPLATASVSPLVAYLLFALLSSPVFYVSDGNPFLGTHQFIRVIVYEKFKLLKSECL